MKPPFARALLIFLVLNLCQTSPGFYVSAVQVFWEKKKNTVGKGEIAHHERLFP